MPDRVILFDFDGVIADSLDAYYPMFAACCRELGFEGPATLESFLDVFDSNAVKGLIRAGVPFYRLKQLGRTLAPRVAELNRQLAPFPGMPELVNATTARVPVYIVTSNVTAATEAFLETHAIHGYRDVLGADRESSKVKKIRKIRALHPGAAPWFIGDTRGDILEGRAAGAVTVAVTWGWHDRTRLAQAQPDHIVDSVAALSTLLGLD